MENKYQSILDREIELLDDILEKFEQIQEVNSLDSKKVLQKWFDSPLKPAICVDNKRKIYIINENQLRNFEDQIESFKNKNYEIESKVLKQYDNNSEIIRQLNEKDEEISDLKKLLKEEKNNFLQVNIDKLNEQIKRKDQQIEELQTQIESVQVQNNQLQQKIKNQDDENKILKEQIKIQCQEIESLEVFPQHDNFYSPENFLKLKVQIENQSILMETQKKQIELYKNNEYDMLQKLKQYQNQESKKMKQYFDDSLKFFGSFNKESQDINEISSYYMQNIIFQQEVEKLQEQLKNMEEKNKMKIKEQGEVIKEQEQKIKELTIIKENLDQAIIDMDQRINRRLDKIKNELFDYKKFKADLENQKQINQEQNQKYLELQEEMKIIQEENEKEIENLQLKIRDLQPYIEKSNKIDYFRKQNNSIKEENKAIQKQLEINNYKFNQIQSEYQEKIEDLTQKLHESLQENALLKGFGSNSRQQQIMDHFKLKYVEAYKETMLLKNEIKELKMRNQQYIQEQMIGWENKSSEYNNQTKLRIIENQFLKEYIKIQEQKQEDLRYEDCMQLIKKIAPDSENAQKIKNYQINLEKWMEQQKLQQNLKQNENNYELETESNYTDSEISRSQQFSNQQKLLEIMEKIKVAQQLEKQPMRSLNEQLKNDNQEQNLSSLQFYEKEEIEQENEKEEEKQEQDDTKKISINQGIDDSSQNFQNYQYQMMNLEKEFNENDQINLQDQFRQQNALNSQQFNQFSDQGKNRSDSQIYNEKNQLDNIDQEQEQDYFKELDRKNEYMIGDDEKEDNVNFFNSEELFKYQKSQNLQKQQQSISNDNSNINFWGSENQNQNQNINEIRTMSQKNQNSQENQKDEDQQPDQKQQDILKEIQIKNKKEEDINNFINSLLEKNYD